MIGVWFVRQPLAKEHHRRSGAKEIRCFRAGDCGANCDPQPEMEAAVALRSTAYSRGTIEVKIGAGQSPHYQVGIIDDTTDYRIAIK